MKYFRSFSSDEQNSFEIVFAAVKQNGCALKYASVRLQDNVDVVLTAVEQNPDAISFASAELRKNDIVISLALAAHLDREEHQYHY